MKRFWNYHGWEALACLVASVMLTLNFSQGFYIPDTVADSVPLALLVCGAATFYCYLGSFNRKTMVGFSLGFLVIAVSFFLFLGRAGIDIADQEGSPTAVYIYYIAVPLITVITFLLSRSRLGIVILFLLGACIHSLTAFLGFEVKIWCTALFALAAVVLFLMRQYRVTVLRGNTVSPGFARYFGLTAGVGLAGVVLAALCWVLVIHPLRPPTLDLELLTKYMQYEILEMVGIAKQYPVPDEDRTAREEDQTLLADEPEEEPEAPPDQQSPEDGGNAPPPIALDPAQTTNVNAVTYERNITSIIIVLFALIVLVILLIPVLVRYLRGRRLAKLTQGEPRQQIVSLYRFYLRQFARIGYARLPSETEQEYTTRCGEHLAPYLKGGVDLPHMTELYLDARYGGLPAAEEACRALAALYPVFLRNYRMMAGRWRYLAKYFVL